jgi:hypothetical protein
VLIALCLAGVAAGLWLLARGFAGYRTATSLADTSTSTVATMAAGEVRLAGTIEPAEVTLVSPLQSRPCVYYRASVRADDELGVPGEGSLEEERAVGFRLRDATGSVRVFPRGARWDAPRLFDERDGTLGDRPPGLDLRTGSAVAQGQPDVEAQVANLLRVDPAGTSLGHPLLRAGSASGRRRYQESRLAPGDAVTIVGRALPFSDLDDPAEADVAVGHGLAADDPEVLGDLAEARAAGLLADDPEEAWGNAAIPGFGIGQPVREPELDPGATRPAIAPAEVAERFERSFHIPDHELVLATGPGMPLLIAHGSPGAAVERHQDRFVVGLVGAVLAIGSAMALAVVLGGGAVT